MLEVVLEALKESLLSLPILFVVYFLIELIENKKQVQFEKFVAKSKKSGPLWGSVIGCVPQCAFSAVMADLFSRKMITIGTLFAVFIATSDEAIAILISSPQNYQSLLILIVSKLIIAILVGFIIDLIFKNQKIKDDNIHHDKHFHHEHSHNHKEMEISGESGEQICKCETCCVKCEKEKDECEECEHNKLHHAHEIEHCNKKHGIYHILLESLKHTAIIFACILFINILLSVVIELVGLENLQSVLLCGTIFEPIILTLIGLIPNCGASVAITDLYLNGIVGLGSCIGALCTGAGLGLVILFKNNKNLKQNIFITISLYAIGVLVGFILNLILMAF